jgi:hypothetical protein
MPPGSGALAASYHASGLAAIAILGYAELWLVRQKKRGVS